ncbi:hypothetical protein KVR01_003056 [Diaporthe batatas]|uniref:uncharacterized protein n=1 Tax=Diaporthe batatas TaxID=748121 RepID=UPI001D0360AC|nr:uncharacterized protein KVR01_003056 [Diaporthe batatas]KAG8167367.1 hypothetical protein KVR01_003056 [Diaporthe batatas]
MGMHSNTFRAPSTQTFPAVNGLEAKNSAHAAQRPSVAKSINSDALGIRVLIGGRPAIIKFPRPQPPPSPRPRPRPGPVRPPPGVPTPPPTPRRPAQGASTTENGGKLGGEPGFVTFPRPQPPPSPRPRPRPGPVRPPPGNPTPPPTPRR